MNARDLARLPASVMQRARYHLQVDLVGAGYLRYQRRRAELTSWLPPRRRHPHFSPMLQLTPRLKEVISRHFLVGRHANLCHKVAWVTSGAPVEPLKALGFYTLYPENHGAVCGVRRCVGELTRTAEKEGFSPDLCSYARTDLGSLLSGQTPVGRLPRPDLLLCCTNICQTVLYWYRVLAHHFRVPLVLIDTPFVYDEAPAHALAHVRRQVDEAIPILERVAGRAMSPARLETCLRRSHEAVELWAQIIQRGSHRPAPISAFEEFFHMAPIVELRGESVAVEYYAALLKELDRRVRRGQGVLRQERKRLIWDNLPIWFWVRPLAETLAARGVALVASTYTNAWGELVDLIDPDRPLDSLARVYLHPILNQGTRHKLATMVRLVEQYHADGVILHSDRSCKPYSIGQLDQRERLVREHQIPALVLDGDHNDPQLFSEAQASSRLEAFLEMVGA